MPSLFSRRLSLRLLLIPPITIAFVTALTSAGVADPTPPQPVAVVQDTCIKSGTYEGTVLFERQDMSVWNGKASLSVDGRKFKLTYNGSSYDGKLVTLISGGQPGGYIQFDNDRQISIKWTEGQEKPSRLKIVNVRGACIKFRFCSNDITPTECKRSLAPG